MQNIYFYTSYFIFIHIHWENPLFEISNVSLHREQRAAYLSAAVHHSLTKTLSSSLLNQLSWNFVLSKKSFTFRHIAAKTELEKKKEETIGNF